MSDSSYADEYGKWLESSHSRIPDVSEEEDSNDANDNSRECVLNTIYNHESENEKLLKNLPYGRDNKLSSESMDEQAPILIDDDDDDLFTSKKHYEDEPPVLEPVQNQIQSCKISAVQNLQFSPQICMRSYSRNNKIRSNKHSLKEQKMCSNKDTVILISSDLCDESKHVKCKDNKSGNIFDKFITESYDSPPPLIPNPETLQTCSQLPSLLAKNPNHSPNFCAMEADSTSEISGDKLNSVFIPHRFSKNSHEVSVECDSTCMLAASPFIVSPASISNSEMEETTDSGDCGNRDGEFETGAYKSKKCDNPLEQKTESEHQSTLMHNAIQKCLVDDICKDISEAAYCDISSELQVVEEQQCYPDPQLLDISTHLNNEYRSLSIDVDSDILSTVSESYTEPPILSAVSPLLVRSQTRFRKEQYTVESPKSFSKSRKRPHVKSSEHMDDTYSSPPILNCVSETAITTPRSRRSRVVSEHSQNECLGRHQDETNSSRRRRRCNSLPFTGGTDYCGTLSDNLHSFINGTSELSNLQTHMHRLLYHLFPQLKTELGSMSPESFKFENLLSDIVELLEHPDDQDNSSPPPVISCRNIKPTCIYEYPRSASFTSKLSSSHQSISDEPISTLLSTSNSQAAADYAKIVLNSDAISCSYTPSSKLSSSYQSRQRRQLKTQQKDEKDIVAPLSRLSVRDMEDILRPSKVLLCRDPEVSIERFVKLSCRAMQLLLPDLTVSVYNELGHSPCDLVAFINNVILINSRRRQKY